MEEILGYTGAVLIGLVLGLLGGGGSILTIPVLVYLLHITPVSATTYSLFIVGITSLAGAVGYLRSKMVNVRAAVLFALPSLIAVFVMRSFVMPRIPDEILSVGEFVFSKNLFVMLLFALLMLMASFSMISKKKNKEDGIRTKENLVLISIAGFSVGSFTGIVGAGGGFLIVPALVLLLGLPMKNAVGTSLMIIAINSLIGFTGDIWSSQAIHWSFLLKFSVLTVAGIVMGSYLAKFISGSRLKPAFGWFVLVMGIYIIVKEVFFNRVV